MLLILLFMAIHLTHGLIAYDCGSPNMNITTMSLLSIGECKIPTSQPTVTPTQIQLLQLSEYSNAHVRQCRIEIDRSIFYCGMHSHVSLVNDGRREYIMEINSETCLRLHMTGALRIGDNHLITGIGANQTVKTALTLVGTISNDGSCTGTGYSDPYGTWNNVVVQAVVRVSIRDYYASTKPGTNKIILNSGVQCTLSDGSCMDVEGGNTYWAPIPVDNCKFGNYDVLFQGKVNKVYDNSSSTQAVYAITTGEITFALTRQGHFNLCNYILIRTEHPKLFILEIDPEHSFAKKRPIAINNLDIFTYMNSKFVYLEKHVRNQMTALYHDVLTQQCKLEKQVLENALSLAKILPEDFSYQLMKSPGYMAVVSGEVIHVVKCVPTTIKRRETKECYQQLPVFRGNSSMFMAPKTRILLKTGTQIDCNPYVPVMYLLRGTWYKITPRAASTIPPNEIQPTISHTWTYTNPAELATSGIYSAQELEKLRDHIMFPVEKPAVLNTLARGVTGQTSNKQGVSFINLLDEETLQKIATNTWARLWGWFTGFGTFSAGMFGVFVTIKLIKFVIDTALHGYALHQVYGWSVHLLGAIWDSVTNVLIHLKTNRSNRDEYSKNGTLEKSVTYVHEPQPEPIMNQIPDAPPNSNTTDGSRLYYARIE